MQPTNPNDTDQIDLAAAAEAEAARMVYTPPQRMGHTFSLDLDGVRLATATARVLGLLIDGQPHTIEQVRLAGGAQGDRRARDLRDARWGALPLDVYRDARTPALWWYRLDIRAITSEQWATVRRVLARQAVSHA